MQQEVVGLFTYIYTESSSLWVCTGPAVWGVEEDGS